MKKLFTLMVLTAVTLTAIAQSPQKMSYQCVVRNSSGALVPNQAVGIKISILQGSATGTVVYSETFSPNPQTNANGLVTLEIGSGTSSVGTFAGIDWSDGPYFLKAETDPAGGTIYTITGTSQLLSVPYALYAKTAANGFSGAWADITGKPAFALVATSGSYNDLLNKPALFDGTWTSLTGKPSLANVATTGSYNDLLNRPALFSGAWADITGKPTTLSGYGITDADNSITNEIQTLNLSGTTLSLSSGGGSVTLPSSGGGDNWGTQTVVTDATMAGNGTTATPLRIADNGVNSLKIQDGSIVTADLADQTVSTAKLGNLAVSADKMQNGAVISDKLANGSVTGAKIAQGGATSGQALKWNGTTWAPATDNAGGLTLPYSGTATSDSPLFNITNLGTSGAISTLSSGNYGIWGESSSSSGIGVYGVNKTSTGTTYGVFGDVYSSAGFSGFFQGGKFYVQGNAGIGTQNPSAKLEVSGQVKITGGSPGAGKVLTSDAAGLASWQTIESNPWLKNGNNIYYSSGNVGIGLNNPTAMMEIYGNSVDNYPTLLLSEADGYSRVSFRTMSTSTKHWVLAGHTNVTDGDSQFHLNYNNGTTGKNIFSVYGNSNISFDGKVGIGTTAPGSLLQVHSNITYVNNVTPIIKISDNFKTWNIGLGDPGDRFSISSEENIDRLTILKSNGFVGLGTTAPSAKLEVAGQVKITGGAPGAGKVLTSDAAGLASWQAPQPSTWLKNGSDIYYNSGRVAIGMTFPRYELTIYADNEPHIGFYNSTSGTSGTDGFTISTGATGSPVWLWNWESGNIHFGTNNANRMIINADGHVSMMSYLDLNTDGTFGALYVRGKQALWWDGTYFSWGYDATYNYFARKVTIGNAANPGYMLYVQGSAYATGTWSSSDACFKKNITSIDNSLEKLMAVRGTRFEFRTDEFRDYQFAEGPQFGFIAQELEDVFPEMVKTDSNGYKSINYSEMIPVLVEALKEQQKQIEELKQLVSDLKEK